jgi:hypothetical protein
MQSFGQLMGACLNTVAIHKEHLLATMEEKNKNEQIDEEDEAQIKEEIYKVAGAATYINECSDIIMTTYGRAASDMIDLNVRPYFGKILQQYRIVS